MAYNPPDLPIVTLITDYKRNGIYLISQKRNFCSWAPSFNNAMYNKISYPLILAIEIENMLKTFRKYGKENPEVIVLDYSLHKYVEPKEKIEEYYTGRWPFRKVKKRIIKEHATFDDQTLRFKTRNFLSEFYFNIGNPKITHEKPTFTIEFYPID